VKVTWSESSRSLKKPRALGVYIYGGGFTFGAEKHWDVVAHLEDGPIVNTKVFNHNRPDVPIRYAPDWGLDVYKNNVDVVFCNPPCAVWSPIGISLTRGREAYKNDARIECWENCIKVGLAVAPRCLVVETVPRGATLGRLFLLEKARLMQARGYSVAIFLHSSRWMGSPQDRRRLFFIAMKDHVWEPLSEEWLPGRTVDKVLGEVTEKGEPAWLMPKTWKRFWEQQGSKISKERKLAREVARQEGVKPLPGFMNYRLIGDKPMGAFCGNYYLHPHEPRSLTMPEARALCEYPKSYSFPDEKSLKVHATVFAQAVMPRAGEWIARSINAVLNKEKGKTPSKEVTLWDWRVQKKAPTRFDVDVYPEDLEAV